MKFSSAFGKPHRVWLAWRTRQRRARLAYRSVAARRKAIRKWLRESRETTNFTYELTSRNLRHLGAFVAQVTDRPQAAADASLRELLEDRQLADHVAHHSKASSQADAAARYARRAGWYAIVRLTQPRVVVETGVDKGLGSCVLAAALQRNARDGAPGYYYGTDMNPSAGWLLTGPYASHGRILYGDSVRTLEALSEEVDLFVNDSDHSAEYEAREYETIASKLSQRAIILGDNAHVTDELYRFAVRTGRKFLYFQEQPYEHWYPGAGIGAAFPPPPTASAGTNWNAEQGAA